MKTEEQILAEIKADENNFCLTSSSYTLTDSAIIKALKECANQSKWISVETELPKEGGYYLCVKTTYLPFAAMFHSDIKRWTYDGEYISPTHYQTLPPAPITNPTKP